jgi:hypothetical protein
MCFYKDIVNYSIFHKIAKEDIVCYKVMTIFKIGNDGVIWVKSINYPKEEIRSYGSVMIPEIEPDLDWLDAGTLVLQSGVIHSYTHLPNTVILNERYVGQSVIVKCRIPKGTPYWVNHRDRVYASTKLILDGIVNSN